MTRSPSTSRPTWDETWVLVALTMARRSACSRAQVGAVVVDPHNRVVATGYNGPPAGYPQIHTVEVGCTAWCRRATQAQLSAAHGFAQDYSDCPSLHAEANALSVCDRSVREGGTIYVTSHVCYGCAKLVANSGLRRVVVHVTEDAPHRDPDRSYALLRSCGLEVLVGAT